ncbi:MAG: peptide-methionine (S)-S-oxide reductase MsrA [Candidatus Sericytochromatia bacterium]|nr:peptide-methionine (S)-S-oxide reductase MsrA [Candidatus Sericytochromatia bacterium]
MPKWRSDSEGPDETGSEGPVFVPRTAVTVRAALSLLLLMGVWVALTRLGPAKGEAPTAGPSAPAAKSAPGFQEAYLGGGCFWCVEAALEQLAGVGDVESGYAGGHLAAPGYAEVCTGQTGHAEVVRVPFDPKVIPYETLLDAFLLVHDPTSRDRQGADVGSQYRSIILVRDQAERKRAEAVLRGAQARFPRPIVTEVAVLKRFWPAEAEHQDYFQKHPELPYCAGVIAPKLEKLRKARPQAIKTPPTAGASRP